MKYRIVCAKPGKLEEQASYLYDNQTNEIWDAEGGLVDFRKDERYAEDVYKRQAWRVWRNEQCRVHLPS